MGYGQEFWRRGVQHGGKLWRLVRVAFALGAIGAPFLLAAGGRLGWFEAGLLAVALIVSNVVVAWMSLGAFREVAIERDAAKESLKPSLSVRLEPTRDDHGHLFASILMTNDSGERVIGARATLQAVEPKHPRMLLPGNIVYEGDATQRDMDSGDWARFEVASRTLGDCAINFFQRSQVWFAAPPEGRLRLTLRLQGTNTNFVDVEFDVTMENGGLELSWPP